jgi:hypothetical protein
MNTPLRQLLATACLFSCTTAFADDDSPQNSPDEAKAAALAWVKLIDDEQYAQSWKQASTRFQAMATEQRWVDAMTQVRQPLGSVVSREFKTANFTHELPRLPKGDYWVIEFATSFEGTPTIETITMMLDQDGKWHALSFRIKPAPQD